jgi:hypothetical protein
MLWQVPRSCAYVRARKSGEAVRFREFWILLERMPVARTLAGATIFQTADGIAVLVGR